MDNRFDIIKDYEPWGYAKFIYNDIMHDERACDFIENYLIMRRAFDWSETTLNEFFMYLADGLLKDTGIWR